MANPLFTSDERPIAQTIAAIPYANPFTSERDALEKEVLGEKYVPVRDSYLLPGQPLHRLEGSLGALLERAELLVRAAQERIARRTVLTDSDRDVYLGLVHFVVFHRHAAAFDALINADATEAARREARGTSTSGPARVTAPSLFERCRRDFAQLVASPALGCGLLVEAPRWFAFYFQVRRAWSNTYAFIHGGSAALRSLRARIWQSIFTHDMRRYLRGLHERMGDITTLITGPSGSGKELVARAIGLSRFIPYDANERRFAADSAASFHPINLSALSPTLIESELFGHRRGAYTGALGDRAGYFEICGEHGTVFLDEIGETAPEIQVKLLRVLQTRQFQRLGDTDLRTFRGRVVAATNRDLPGEIRAGRFREDLFFRICADRIETPSLKEALAGDAEELRCIVAHVCHAQAGPVDGPELTEEVIRHIERKLGRDYDWPGNFRELEQCVRNILVHGDYQPALGDALGGNGAAHWTDAARAGALTMDQLLHHYCRQVVGQAGTLEEAARRLEADRRTVRRYLRSGPSGTPAPEPPVGEVG